MAGIRVTPDQLASTASQVSAGAAGIASELSSLAGQIAPLAADWSGVAQTRFETLWAEWQRSAQGLNEALTGVAQLLGQAGQHYADAEAAIAASFNAMS
jgi:WXG100 family type VII secretion target